MNATEDASPKPQPSKAVGRKRTRVFIIGSLSIFIFLALLAHSIPFFGWDLKLARALQTIAFLRLPMLAISLFGNDWTPYVLTMLTALIFLILRLRTEAIALMFSACGSAFINGLIKIIVARPRPTDEFVTILQQQGGHSFPSGHVTFYVCYFGFLFFLAYFLLQPSSKLRTIFMLLTATPILLVGFSRVYLGAHWPSDTLGSYLWSSLWLMLSVTLYQRFKSTDSSVHRA